MTCFMRGHDLLFSVSHFGTLDPFSQCAVDNLHSRWTGDVVAQSQPADRSAQCIDVVAGEACAGCCAFDKFPRAFDGEFNSRIVHCQLHFDIIDFQDLAAVLRIGIWDV